MKKYKKRLVLIPILIFVSSWFPILSAQTDESPAVVDTDLLVISKEDDSSSLPEEGIEEEILLVDDSVGVDDFVAIDEETVTADEVSSVQQILPGYTNSEPLNQTIDDDSEIPIREKLDPRLDKMFSVLSKDPLVDKHIGPKVREKYDMWEDQPDSGYYIVADDGLLTLQMMIDRAYEHNPSIKMLQAQLNQAKLDVVSAKSNYYPKITFEGSMSLSSKKLIDSIDLREGQLGNYTIGNLPGETVTDDLGSGIGDSVSVLPDTATSVVGDTSISIPPEDYRLWDGFPQTFYNFKFVLEQPLFTWGKIPMAVEAYKTAVHAAKLQVAKKKKEVRAEVSIYYQTLYYLEKMRSIIKDQNKVMDRLMLVTKESYKTGFIIYTDYLDVQVKGQKLIVADYKIQDQYKQILIKLASQTGYRQIETEMIDFSNIDEDWSPELMSESQYVELAKSLNIDLRLLDALKEITALQAKIEKSSSYLKPDFGLQLSVGSMGPDFPFLQRGWYGHNSQNIIGTIGFKSTLVDGGKILAAAMKKNEELHKTLYQIQLGEAQVHSFLARQLSMIELNNRNLEYYSIKQESDQQLVALRKIQYDTGGTEIDYLRSLIENNSNYIEIYSEKIDLIKNYYMLLLVSGLL